MHCRHTLPLRLALERVSSVAHTRAVSCLACDTLLDPSEAFVYSGGLDNKCRMWSPAGDLLRTFSGHTRPVRCLLGVCACPYFVCITNGVRVCVCTVCVVCVVCVYVCVRACASGPHLFTWFEDVAWIHVVQAVCLMHDSIHVDVVSLGFAFIIWGCHVFPE